MLRFHDGNAVRLLVLQRAVSDRAFEKRQLRMLKVIGIEIACRFGTALVPHGGPSISDLSPRLRTVLHCLLDGDSEKQVAARLDLSPHTVHDYVKAMHTRFQVKNRGELLARCQPLKAALYAEQPDL